jgi:hypothetical protein
VRTTGRNLLKDLASEYAKRAQAKAALVSTSWHNDMLALSESIIVKHAAELISRRRQLTITSKHGLDDSRWLQEVPGSGLSFTHLDKPHHERSVPSTPDPAPESGTPPGKAWRGWLWIALTILAVAAVLAKLTV